MEYIKGNNIYDGQYDRTKKEHILEILVDALSWFYAVFGNGCLFLHTNSAIHGDMGLLKMGIW